ACFLSEPLGSLALLRHACHVAIRFKCDIMSARFECLCPAFVEDHLFADVVIALLISFQLSLGRRYDRCWAWRVVVALCWALCSHRRGNRQRKNRCQEQLFGDVHRTFSLVLVDGKSTLGVDTSSAPSTLSGLTDRRHYQDDVLRPDRSVIELDRHSVCGINGALIPALHPDVAGPIDPGP